MLCPPPARCHYTRGGFETLARLPPRTYMKLLATTTLRSSRSGSDTPARMLGFPKGQIWSCPYPFPSARPLSLRINNVTRAGDSLYRALVRQVKPSVFGVYLDPAHTQFLGSAWKAAEDVYVTCFHVVGNGLFQVEKQGVFKPNGTFKARTFYLRNGRTQVRCQPRQQLFAGKSDLAVLDGGTGNTARSLEVLQRLVDSEASVTAVGFTGAGTERTGHGRLQEQLLDGTEVYASLDCDNGMSGCPVVDTHGCVVGMVTGWMGHTVPKTRVLSHLAIIIAMKELTV